jgi:hypothetical protein
MSDNDKGVTFSLNSTKILLKGQRAKGLSAFQRVQGRESKTRGAYALSKKCGICGWPVVKPLHSCGPVFLPGAACSRSIVPSGAEGGHSRLESSEQKLFKHRGKQRLWLTNIANMGNNYTGRQQATAIFPEVDNMVGTQTGESRCQTQSH